MALALCVVSAGCSSKPPPSTYKEGVVPGITQHQLVALLGPPSSTLPFAVPGIRAQILSYPFGQVAIQNGKVITVTIASDPSYTGPLGIRLRTLEDQLMKQLRMGKHRVIHRDSYDVLAGDIDTRTRDVYDETDHVMYELAAANANDPEAPFSVVSINLADHDGFVFLEAVTQAKVSGLYPGQRIDNFVSESL